MANDLEIISGTNELELANKFNEIARTPQIIFSPNTDSERAKQIAQHKAWFHSIRHELPSPINKYKVGVYIRYFNQTKYEDYLLNHKQQYIDNPILDDETYEVNDDEAITEPIETD